MKRLNLHTGSDIQRTTDHVSKVEKDPDWSPKFWPHGARQHEVDSSCLDRPVGGNGTDGEDGGDKDDIGDDEEQHSLKETSIANNVADAKEEEGREHGEGDWREDTLDGAKGSRASRTIIFLNQWLDIGCPAKNNSHLSSQFMLYFSTNLSDRNIPLSPVIRPDILAGSPLSLPRSRFDDKLY